MKFKSIVDKNCNISDKINTVEDYIKICNKKDVIIFGSDQIWNPNWYHPFYFGNYEQIKTKLIAYAPSFGVSEISNNRENIKKSISRFSSIALREKEGCMIVESLLNRKTKTVVDPTLFLDSKEWKFLEEKTNNNFHNYILCYMLSDNPNYWKAIKAFAKKNRKQLVVIPHDGYSYIKSKYTIKDCSVGNFLYLIKNADYIVTDSFHGTVFSIIYDKNFCVFERHNPKDCNAQNSRIYNLLRIAKAEECLITYNSNKIDKVVINPNYYNNLKDLICESKEYLKESIYNNNKTR